MPKNGFLSEIVRYLEKVDRTTFALFCFAMEIVISIVFCLTLVWFFEMSISPTYGVFVGVAVGLFWVATSFRNFTVSVPEITGLLTVNVFKEGIDALTSYGTGFHFRYPWEQVKKGNYINVRQVTQVVVQTYPSEDALMHVVWLYQYTPTLKGLPRYISADDKSIKDGLDGTGSSVLKNEIASRPGEKCRREGEDIEDALKEKFKGTSATSLLERYGIELDAVEISDLDFDASVQAARSAKAEGALLSEIAAAYQKDRPNLSDKEAMNFAFVTLKKASKNIFEIEGLGPLGPAVQAALDKMKGGN